MGKSYKDDNINEKTSFRGRSIIIIWSLYASVQVKREGHLILCDKSIVNMHNMCTQDQLVKVHVSKPTRQLL